MRMKKVVVRKRHGLKEILVYGHAARGGQALIGSVKGDLEARTADLLKQAIPADSMPSADRS